MDKNNIVGDVWCLESADEQNAGEYLGLMVARAENGSKAAQKLLVQLFGNNWETIHERVNCEGSTWIVWWLDGVHALMEMARTK